MGALRGTAASSVAVLVLLLATLLQGQAPPATPLTLISREGRRPVPTTVVNGQELIALDDVASLFQGTLREDALAGGATLTYRGRTIVVSPNQATASVNGRVIALPSPVVRAGRRWLVPVEFLQSALGQIYDQRLQVRRASRLVLLGDVRVPRVTARIDSPGPPTRATIEVTPAAPIAASVETGRVVVRVDADALDLVLPAPAGLITQWRAGDQPNTIVAILDAAAGAARTTPQTSDTSARVTIEVQGQGAPAPATPDTATPRPSPVPGPPVNPDELLTPRPALQTVIIDPGHGGPDVGARGPSGTEEKQLALDEARRLRMLLETRLGVRVVLTREDDTAVGPDVRAAIANNNKGDLFLSLHANTSPSPAVAGAEVYYLQLDREGESVRQEASSSSVAVPAIGTGTRRLDIIPWELAQARHVDESAALATLIAEELARHVAMGPSPVRRAPIRLLEGLNMPAALVEIAYLTNPGQEKLVATDDYKAMVAQALYDAVVRFRARLEERRTR